MRKLKSLDVSDVLKSVKGKKLPKEALKTILPRFRLEKGELQLKENVESLKGEATALFTPFVEKNKALIKVLADANDSLTKLSDFTSEPDEI